MAQATFLTQLYNYGCELRFLLKISGTLLATPNVHPMQDDWSMHHKGDQEDRTLCYLQN